MCCLVLQEVPLYGQQPDTAETWARGEDPRYQKDVEHGRVFARSTGALIYLSILSVSQRSALRFLKEGKRASTEGGGDDADDLEDDLSGDESGKPAQIRTTFELADTLYAEAELEETDTVFLWLGVLSHVFASHVPKDLLQFPHSFSCICRRTSCYRTKYPQQ